MMMDIIRVQDTNTGWTNSVEGYPTMIALPGLMRGFNIEYKRPDGSLDYGSCIFTYNEPEDDNFEFKCQIDTVNMLGHGEPTGRVIFRGYVSEMYDCREHEEYVEDVSVEDVCKILREVQEGTYVDECYADV